MGETHKIAAILVADVVGYSRLAAADEDRTLARLRGVRTTTGSSRACARRGCRRMRAERGRRVVTSVPINDEHCLVVQLKLWSE